VAVGVGLDDRLDEDARPGQRARDGEVGGERREVDLDPGRPRQRRQAGGGEAVLDPRPGRCGPCKSFRG